MKLIFLIIIFFSIFTSCTLKYEKNYIEFCNQKILLNETHVVCINKKNVNLKKVIILENLEKLELINVEILNNKAFLKFKKLKYLVLNNVKANNLNKFLSVLSNLEVLYLKEIKLNALNFITKTKKLKILFLLKNNLNTNYNNLKKFLKKGNVYLSLDSAPIGKDFIEDSFICKYKKNLDTTYCNPKFNNIIEFKKDLYKNVYFFNKGLYYTSFINDILMKYPNLIFLMKHRNIEVMNLWDKNYRMLKMNNLSQLILYKNLKILKVYPENNKSIKIIKELNKLEILYLIGEKIKIISKLPKRLKKLYLFDTRIKKFSFLENSNLKTLEIITKNFKSDIYKKLILQYPNIEIQVKDYYLNSCGIFNNNFKKYLIKNESIYPNLNYRALGDKNYKKIKIKDNLLKYDYHFCDLQKKIINYLKNNELDEIILTNNKDFISHILKHYDFNLNELNESQKTILDEVSGEVDKEIISLLKIHGAKRSCEILKTKCKFLSPEIEKILKNDKK